MDLGIKNKIALVTASSRGIGKASAMALAAEGCDVAVCSRNKEELIKTAEEINKKYGTRTSWYACDLNKTSDIENVAGEVKKDLGSVDILVTNCGGPPAGYLKDIKESDWQSAFDQILFSVVKFCNLLLPDMISKKWGRIINLTSLTVKQPVDNLMLSNALRTGLIGFAKSLSNEAAPHNVTVNNIAPGYTLTDRLYELASIRGKQQGKSLEEILSGMAADIPMKRLAQPEEIAAAVVFLASENAGYITGNTIHVDGGVIKGLF